MQLILGLDVYKRQFQDTSVFRPKKRKTDVAWKGVSFSETEPVKSGVVKKKKSACVETYFCNCYVE